MAIAFVSSTTQAASSITSMPSHSTGNILIMWAFNNTSTTGPSIPAGWTSVGVNAGTLCASTIAYKVAASGAETSGTWTNATDLECHVYSGQAAVTPVVNQGAQTGSSASISYSGVVTLASSGNEWIIRFCGITSNNAGVSSVPAGFTNRTSLANTGATTTKVSIRDDTAGTVRMIIEVPTLETRGFMLPVDSAVPQTAVNKNWTAQCGSSTTALEVTLFYVSMV